MPLYEYRCTKCGHQFEVRHAVADTVGRCEQCGAPVRRVFSPVGIIFKGPGFHINDYRKTSARADGDGASASAPKSSSSKEPSTSTAAAGGSGGAPSTAGAATKSS